MDEATSDESLIAAARSGDKQALETLLERHQEQVYRFGMKMCRDPEDAKDVLQETLLAMARGVRDFRGASSISTWLYTIARSFCIKKHRRSKFAPEQEQSLDTDAAVEVGRLAAPDEDPAEMLAGKQVEHVIEETDARVRRRFARAIQVQSEADLGFLGLTGDLRFSFRHRGGKSETRNPKQIRSPDDEGTSRRGAKAQRRK